MLVYSLLLMGAATVLIGLLPGYASIGIWAPFLLVVLRFAQGFGVGGEWGGAALMAVEHAPEHRRGFYGAWPQVGVSAGIVLGTGYVRPAVGNVVRSNQHLKRGSHPDRTLGDRLKRRDILSFGRWKLTSRLRLSRRSRSWSGPAGSRECHVIQGNDRRHR
jgi:hypothetical protein